MDATTSDQLSALINAIRQHNSHIREITDVELQRLSFRQNLIIDAVVGILLALFILTSAFFCLITR